LIEVGCTLMLGDVSSNRFKTDAKTFPTQLLCWELALPGTQLNAKKKTPKKR
jgi:hypothetical protein